MTKAYKLLRVRTNGSLGPLFVGRELILWPGLWFNARSDLEHKGLKHRPGFHCCQYPNAPHLKLKLKSGETRVWALVEIQNWTTLTRPKCQGGVWYLAQRMKVVEVL